VQKLNRSHRAPRIVYLPFDVDASPGVLKLAYENAHYHSVAACPLSTRYNTDSPGGGSQRRANKQTLSVAAENAPPQTAEARRKLAGRKTMPGPAAGVRISPKSFFLRRAFVTVKPEAAYGNDAR
jgi:hypothetical protein